MRNIILFTLFLLSLCAIVITSVVPSPKEELAYRMSKSENFKAIMIYGKQMASHVTKLPDSIKNKLRQVKLRIDLLQKNNSLNVYQKRDSILKLTNSASISDSEFIYGVKNMGPVYIMFNNEFPEFKKMPKEERSLVFKKAAAIFIKNPKI